MNGSYLFRHLFLFTGIFPLLSCFSDIKAVKKAEDNYNNYCMGCHGPAKEKFVNKEWIYGKEHEEVFYSVKYGREEMGMPSFEAAFSDDEIDAMVNYLLEKNNDNDKILTSDKMIISSEVQNFYVDTVISGLSVVWGMTWLPDGNMLITERSGTLYRFANNELITIEGLPPVFVFGQGGLLDIELHPNYENTGWIYITYSKPAINPDKDGGNTALIRAKLDGNKLTNIEELYAGHPATRRGQHFGSRIEFDRNGYLYFTIGERGHKENAQLLGNSNGKLHRINDDGSVPIDNPFYNVEGADKTIYNFGHRNQQGLAMHPESGEIWSHEHGPRGGDEINIEKRGANYGWPEITFGINYNGTIITEDTAKAGMEQPVIYYDPSIAPSGMDFVEGTNYPNWKGNILIGSLRFRHLVRVVLNNDKVIHQEKLIEDIGRVRDVKMGPDNLIYVSVEGIGVLRLVPVD
ncbi:PQQ-dependent sugar dehydrogenase [Saccharicrinis sp. FJH62]|uniref:PQQ-dependent sugar dehydrogenase n=1 Tax=Saccharicrinis sp. FJH62 TaxID=3344657 RepID=UPI0035D505AB